jgi:hypothetical protein
VGPPGGQVEPRLGYPRARRACEGRGSACKGAARAVLGAISAGWGGPGSRSILRFPHSYLLVGRTHKFSQAGRHAAISCHSFPLRPGFIPGIRSSPFSTALILASRLVTAGWGGSGSRSILRFPHSYLLFGRTHKFSQSGRHAAISCHLFPRRPGFIPRIRSSPFSTALILASAGRAHVERSTNCLTHLEPRFCPSVRKDVVDRLCAARVRSRSCLS